LLYPLSNILNPLGNVLDPLSNSLDPVTVWTFSVTVWTLSITVWTLQGLEPLRNAVVDRIPGHVISLIHWADKSLTGGWWQWCKMVKFASIFSQFTIKMFTILHHFSFKISNLILKSSHFSIFDFMCIVNVMLFHHTDRFTQKGFLTI
jgi:hypothetical protein